VRRRSLAGRAFVPAPEHPAPTYPEYAQLLADATEAVRKAGHFVDPVELRRVMHLHRSWDWKTSVLGYVGDGTATRLEMYLLLLADERDLEPPLPQWLVDRRAADARADAERQAAYQRIEDLDQAAWEKARADCPVEVAVRRNGHARTRNGRMHQLGHVVPLVDAVSGPTDRPRRHPAGRAVCESETRARPLDLSGGTGGPATCDRCLKYTPHLRPAGEPQ
jgi:Asp-tRNA(Asn)/Glu-tRNA(Gln) amidotransferase A subunit family amidase